MTRTNSIITDYMGRRWYADAPGVKLYRQQLEIDVEVGRLDGYDTAEGHTCVELGLYHCSSCICLLYTSPSPRDS